MPIVVECQCGKRFRAKDELAGKSIPCPGCGSTLNIPMPVVPAEPATPPKPSAPAPRPAGGVVVPGYVPPRNRGPQQTNAPRFAISKRTAIYLSLFILVPLVLLLAKIGPVNAIKEWQKAESGVEGDITDVFNRFLVQYRAAQGYRMSEARYVPQVKDVVLDPPLMMIRFPKQVSFQGQSTEGRFRGTYFTQTRRVEGAIDIDDKEHAVRAATRDGNVTFDP